MPEYAAEDPNNLLLGGPDGTFMEAAEAAGIVDFARTRGAALADFNLDGMLDLVEVNRRENVHVWRNVGWGTAEQPEPMGNWVAIRLNQPGPNRERHRGVDRGEDRRSGLTPGAHGRRRSRRRPDRLVALRDGASRAGRDPRAVAGRRNRAVAAGSGPIDSS